MARHGQHITLPDTHRQQYPAYWHIQHTTVRCITRDSRVVARACFSLPHFCPCPTSTTVKCWRTAVHAVSGVLVQRNTAVAVCIGRRCFEAIVRLEYYIHGEAAPATCMHRSDSLLVQLSFFQYLSRNNPILSCYMIDHMFPHVCDLSLRFNLCRVVLNYSILSASLPRPSWPRSSSPPSAPPQCSPRHPPGRMQHINSSQQLTTPTRATTANSEGRQRTHISIRTGVRLEQPRSTIFQEGVLVVCIQPGRMDAALLYTEIEAVYCSGNPKHHQHCRHDNDSGNDNL